VLNRVRPLNGIPEIPREQLNANTLANGVLNHSSLLVRSMNLWIALSDCGGDSSNKADSYGVLIDK